jgi:hypothetical protein
MVLGDRLLLYPRYGVILFDEIIFCVAETFLSYFIKLYVMHLISSIPAAAAAGIAKCF